jgi:hypothetical protein
MSYAPSAHSIRRLLALGAAVVLSLGLVGSPAAATGKPDQAGDYYQRPTPYHNTGTFDPECEDVDVSVAYDYQGVDSVRIVPGSDNQAFLLKDRFRFEEIWSDASTGEVLLVWRGRYRFQEVRADFVPNSDVPDDLVPPEGLVGPVYRFTAVERGHDRLRDADGRVLYRTAGLAVYENLFDTLGDQQPGGTSLSFEVVKTVGPHPLVDVDVCDVAAEQVG